MVKERNRLRLVSRVLIHEHAAQRFLMFTGFRRWENKQKRHYIDKKLVTVVMPCDAQLFTVIVHKTRDRHV